MTRPFAARPHASIIVSSFNYEQYLAEAIDSALAQTSPGVEVIVVDDGSTDGSREVIDRYGQRVLAIFKSNGGQGSALNEGFAQSRGEVVLFVDSDDVLCPQAVERILPVMADPAVAKVHWHAIEADEAGRPTGRMVPHLPLSQGDLRERVLTRGPYGYFRPPTSANAWSRRLLGCILPMPERSFRTCPDLYLGTLAPLYGLVECVEPSSLWRKHAINHSSREDFATRVREGIERDEVTMRALIEHAQRQGLAVDPENWRAYAWWGQIGAAIADIISVVPEGGSFILADSDDWASGPRIAGRSRVPFCDREGVYWGWPADDAAAITELESQRARGLRFFVVPFPHLWCLEHYRGMVEWLRTNAREHLHNDRAAIFEIHE